MILRILIRKEECPENDHFLNITGNEGKTTVLEEIIKAVIILKTAFIIPELLVNFIGK